MAWFVHHTVAAVNQSFYLILKFDVQSQVDAKVADMKYVAEVTEPRIFIEPCRLRPVNNVAQRVARANGIAAPLATTGV